MRDFICKVVRTSDYIALRKTGFLPNQPSDIGCYFIHACDPVMAPAIIRRFYDADFNNTKVLAIDRTEAEKAGFKVVYEKNSSGAQYYWHLYRKDTGLLLPANCLSEIN